MICWFNIHCWMSPLKIWVGKCLSKNAVDIYEMRILAPVLDPPSLEIKFKWGNDKKEAAVKFLALFLNTKTAFSKPCSTQIQALPLHSKLYNANNWQFGFHTFWHLTTLIQSDLFQIFHRCSNRCDKLSEGRSCFIFLFLLDKWMLDSRVHKAEVKRWKQFILVALSYSSVPRYTSQQEPVTVTLKSKQIVWV